MGEIPYGILRATFAIFPAYRNALCVDRGLESEVSLIPPLSSSRSVPRVGVRIGFFDG